MVRVIHTIHLHITHKHHQEFKMLQKRTSSEIAGSIHFFTLLKKFCLHDHKERKGKNKQSYWGVHQSIQQYIMILDSPHRILH